MAPARPRARAPQGAGRPPRGIRRASRWRPSIVRMEWRAVVRGSSRSRAPTTGAVHVPVGAARRLPARLRGGRAGGRRSARTGDDAALRASAGLVRPCRRLGRRRACARGCVLGAAAARRRRHGLRRRLRLRQGHRRRLWPARACRRRVHGRLRPRRAGDRRRRRIGARPARGRRRRSLPAVIRHRVRSPRVRNVTGARARRRLAPYARTIVRCAGSCATRASPHGLFARPAQRAPRMDRRIHGTPSAC